MQPAIASVAVAHTPETFFNAIGKKIGYKKKMKQVPAINRLQRFT